MSSTRSQTASEWLIGSADSPIDRVALATYGSVGIPVPVEELLRSRVPVRTVEWPHEVDALMIWHQGEPSQVLLKVRPPAYSRRVRMTCAHELGHITIPWHIGYGAESCATDVDESGGGDYIRTQEKEARSFAGRLLLPIDELRARAHQRDLQNFFDTLDQFEASAWATALRLTQVLKPGFVFTGKFRSLSREDVLRTPGTRGLTVSEARSMAVAGGSFTVGGREIDWYQLMEAERFERSSDTRRPSDIIRGILREVYTDMDEADITATFQSIQGVLGNAVGAGTFENVDDLLRMARQRVDTKVARCVRAHPDWDSYVLKTVENRAMKLGLFDG